MAEEAHRSLCSHLLHANDGYEFGMVDSTGHHPGRILGYQLQQRRTQPLGKHIRTLANSFLLGHTTDYKPFRCLEWVELQQFQPLDGWADFLSCSGP
jgi:hypothetical protein